MITADQVAGKVGGSLDFDGSDDYVNIPHHADFETNDKTLSVWVYSTDVGGEWRGIFSKNREGPNSEWLAMYRSQDATGVWHLRSGATTSNGSVATTGAWTYLVMTNTRGGAATIYKNGANVDNSMTNNAGEPVASTYDVAIGRIKGAGELFQGQIDEARWSKTIRSTDWIQAEYNNQSTPGVGGFLASIGSEETEGAGGCDTTPVVFTTSGSYPFPTGCDSVTIKAWGAGGGGGGGETDSPGTGGDGGGGGFAQGTFTQTGTYTVTVGTGGGGASATSSYGGGGGGRSEVLAGATTLALAAGGGGGAGSGNNAAGVGGPGGGSSGTVGTNGDGTGGSGGSQGSGGAGPGTGCDGASKSGGGGGDTSGCGGDGNAGLPNGGEGGATSCNSGGCGGGGGDGYYGGGGGDTGLATAEAGGGGGGGSSYLDASASGPSNLAGSGTNAGNNADTDYAGNAGQGGSGGIQAAGNAGNAGRIVIIPNGAAGGSSSWHDASWLYRKAITVDSSQVPSDLTDFPVLISLTDPHVGGYSRADGFDLLFTDTDKVTKLDHEIETFTTPAGTLVAWVRVPLLTGAADKVIYLYYGNAGASNQQNAPSVWDPTYAGVWHLKEDPGPGVADDIKDSTSNANDGTAEASMTAGDLVPGQVGDSFDLDGADDFVTVGAPASLEMGTNDLAIAAWVKLSTTPGVESVIIGKGATGGADYGYNFFYLTDDGGKLAAFIGDGTRETSYSNTGLGSNDDAWHYFAVVFDRDADALFYVDGAAAGTESIISKNGSDVTDATENFAIGRYGNNNQAELKGGMDEVRVAKQVLSADWIQAEYNNQSNPGVGGFLKSVGGAEVQGDWWDPAWQFRKKITLDSSQVTSDLTDFPVLISFTDAHVGSYARSDGFDLLFTDTNGVTKLDHEIETYTTGAGTLVAWVRVPLLTSATDKVIYLYYGNSQASDQQNAPGVWDLNYVGVWHLKEDPGPGGADEIKESTANAHHGTAIGTMVPADQGPGKINGSIDFTEVGDEIIGPQTAALDLISSDFTISVWAKDPVSSYKTIVGNAQGDTNGWSFRTSNAGEIELVLGNGSGGTHTTGTTTAPAGWVHMTATFVDSTNTVAFYLNGAGDGTDTFTSTLTTSDYLAIGRRPTGGNSYNTWLDEIRVSKSARFADWIQTEYNNQNNAAGFASIGAAETENGWYDSSWLYRKAITIDPAQVTADLTNFPVLISFTDADIGGKARTDGFDLLFTDTDDTSKLDHEIETYTTGTGVLVSWVRVPNLTSSIAKVIYLYYGNPTASDQQNATGVWDSSYKGVWHLKEDPAGGAPQAKDSTANAKHGTSAGSMTSGDQIPGAINGSLDFDADDRVDVGQHALYDLPVYSWSMWVKGAVVPDSSGPNEHVLWNGNYSFSFAWGHSAAFMQAATHKDSVAWQAAQIATALSADTWYYITGTYDSTNIRVYLDGGLEDTQAAGTPLATIDVLMIGYADVAAFAGQIDEVRVSDIARSSDWIQTSYNNQSNPGGFVSGISGEQREPLPFFDDFNRANSSTVGNGWDEEEMGAGDGTISGSRLVLDSINDGNSPIAQHIFEPQTTGTIRWSYIFNWEGDRTELRALDAAGHLGVHELCERQHGCGRQPQVGRSQSGDDQRQWLRLRAGSHYHRGRGRHRRRGQRPHDRGGRRPRRVHVHPED